MNTKVKVKEKKHYYNVGGAKSACGRRKVLHTFVMSEVTCKQCKQALASEEKKWLKKHHAGIFHHVKHT